MFNIENIAFNVMNYSISYIELIATLFGLISVYFATKRNILTWSTGIINIIFLFLLFYQIQLYADMLLQIYFFIMSIYGWYNWQKIDESNSKNKIIHMNKIEMFYYMLFLLLGTFIFGFIFSNIHMLLPSIFLIEASYPYFDSYTTIASVLATILLSQKKIQTWILWISVDVISVYLYYMKGVYFLSIEYVIFTYLCIFGLIDWYKKL